MTSSNGLWAAFSLRRNFKSLFVPDPAHHAPLNGMRALSLLWVIALHAVWTRGLGKYPMQAYRDLVQSSDPLLQLLLRGDLGVDVFFALSGFLIGTILLREQRETGTLQLGRFYLRRYLRLTPAYLVVVALFTSSPAFPNRSAAWANLLYVNNFLPGAQQCMQWTWSLAVEEQFYLTLPLVLLLLRRPAFRLTGLLALLGLGFAVRAFIIWKHELQMPLAPLLGNPKYYEMWDVLYVKPWARFGCFLVGVIAAHVALTTPREVLVAWLRRTAPVLVPLALILIFGVIALPAFDPDAKWPHWASTVYMTGYAYLFSACVAYAILLTYVPDGPGGLLSRFLSLRVFHPVAKLSYSTYLVHQVFAWLMYLRFKPPPTASALGHLPYVLGLSAFSLLAATVLYLLVESPVLNLRSTTRPAPRGVSDPVATSG